MVFSTPIFIFFFLPIVLTLYPIFPGIRLKNLWLLLVSILFYAWGEPMFVPLMLGSTLMNYGLGLWLERTDGQQQRKLVVGLAIFLNIGVLAFFKYAGFVLANMNAFLGALHLRELHADPVRLPIGISFFTFHALSYVVDIYRRKSRAATNPADTALYIFLFPQLIAGPILRWSAIAPQLVSRVVTRDGFVEGVRRFIGGLAKKMLVANAVAFPADQIFGLGTDGLTTSLAWLGAVCYTLQIYFDFSAYSDMAIGLGKMFGFEFLENFDHPYVSTSIKEFWRRWHISLSNWFRDYLYIPLGGNRASTGRTYLNLLIVFFLCGLWHGASWNFVVWGLYHGFFLVLERTRFGNFIQSLPQSIRHLYAILAVVTGWVLFRAENLQQAMSFLSAMAGLKHAASSQPLFWYISNQAVFGIVAGIIFSMPFQPWLKQFCKDRARALPEMLQPVAELGVIALEPVIFIALLCVSVVWLAGGTYNPFIYFRF